MADENELQRARRLRVIERKLLLMCTCSYPIVRYRNRTGHWDACPAHAETIATQAKRAALARGAI